MNLSVCARLGLLLTVMGLGLSRLFETAPLALDFIAGAGIALFLTGLLPQSLRDRLKKLKQSFFHSTPNS